MTTQNKIDEIVAKMMKANPKGNLPGIILFATAKVNREEGNINTTALLASNRNSSSQWDKREVAENAPKTFKTWGEGCEFDTQHEYQRAMAIKNKMI